MHPTSDLQLCFGGRAALQVLVGSGGPVKLQWNWCCHEPWHKNGHQQIRIESGLTEVTVSFSKNIS